MIAHPNDAARLRVAHKARRESFLSADQLARLREPCCLYVLGLRVGSEVKGPCKVGIAKRPGLRRSELQTGCPWPIVPLMLIRFPRRLAAAEFEQYFHEHYGHHRTSGEWIGLEPQDVLRAIQWSIFDFLCTKGLTEEMQGVYADEWGYSDKDFEDALARVASPTSEVSHA